MKHGVDRRRVLKGMAVLAASLLFPVTLFQDGSLAGEGHEPGEGHAGRRQPVEEGHSGHGQEEVTMHAHEHGKPAFDRYGLVRAEKGYKEYNVRVEQFSYTPEVIRVDRGDLVRLNLDSVDVEHGFYIDGYGVDVTVPEEGAKTIEFVAKKAGAFRVRCSSTCGPFHPFMVGKLVVGPNYRFWWALAAMILAPVGTLAYLTRKAREES